jgi:hypothetical protein
MRALCEASRLDACWSAHPVAISRSQSAVIPRPCVAVVVVIEMTRQLPNMLTAVYRLDTAVVKLHNPASEMAPAPVVIRRR